MRPSKRQPDELRRVSIERAVSMHAEGSCLIKFGNTHVLCTATLEERVPPWLKGQGKGWVTAEYSMLPRATTERTRREVTVGHASGRTQEIQRLIGRALRAVVDLQKLGEKQITVDCDVIQADGGTRTASITGAWVALHDCLAWMKMRDMLKGEVLRDQVAAVSCGLYKGKPVLDLDYPEDSNAEADANFVMTGNGGIVEVQGTAETVPFSQESFDQLMGLARKGISELIALQKLRWLDVLRGFSCAGCEWATEGPRPMPGCEWATEGASKTTCRVQVPRVMAEPCLQHEGPRASGSCWREQSSIPRLTAQSAGGPRF